MQDSDAKRARAERKEREELKLQASKQAEIDQLVCIKHIMLLTQLSRRDPSSGVLCSACGSAFEQGIFMLHRQRTLKDCRSGGMS